MFLKDVYKRQAEEYSQYCASQLDMIEKGLIVTCTLIICISIRESISAVVLMKKNKQLNKLAYICLLYTSCLTMSFKIVLRLFVALFKQ